MKLTETQWTRQVIDLAAALGWRSYHVDSSTRLIKTRFRGLVRVRNVNNQGVGFPDLVLVRRRDARLIFAELKLDKGPRGGTERDHVEPSDAQKAWLDDLESVAMNADRPLRAGISSDVTTPPMWPLRPPIEVVVWRPSHLELVKEILR